jgi:6-pyruvoyl-tetrahydropterin synthase
MKIKTEKTIAIAHLVQSADERSPCRRLHGHNIRIIVEIEGKPKKDGMVVDFRHVKGIINDLDHLTLLPRDIVTLFEGSYVIDVGYARFSLPMNMCYILPVPAVTAEHLAEFLCGKISVLLDDEESVKVTVYESSKSCAEMKL